MLLLSFQQDTRPGNPPILCHNTSQLSPKWLGMQPSGHTHLIPSKKSFVLGFFFASKNYRTKSELENQNKTRKTNKASQDSGKILHLLVLQLLFRTGKEMQIDLYYEEKWVRNMGYDK